MASIRRYTMAAAAFVLSTAGAARAQDVPVYDDALRSGFQDYSYGGVAGDFDFASTAQVHGGTRSIAFTGDDFNALSFAHPTQDFGSAQYPALHFWVHGGAAGGQQLRIYLQLNDAIVAQAELDTYITGGAIAAGVWREVTVTLGAAPLSYAGSFDRIDLQSDVAGAQPVLYVDDVSLVAAGAPAANLVQIEHDVAFDAGYPTFLSDRFTWRDSADKPRVAVLTHNDGPAGPGGVRGGALREFRYQLPDATTRVASVTTYGNGGYGGFGYVVSHTSNAAGCVGDDSPLGDTFPGTIQRVFEGRHHVIFRFTTNYPRNCATTLPVVSRNVPVVIDWVFSTGRDNPVWAVTWNLDQAVPAASVNTFWDDSRGPYGELNIDGDGWTDIDGVAWGDRYKFTSTSAPVSLASGWTYNAANAVPYVKLWLNAPMAAGHTKDATMGLVQTQTMTQQDAGGGRLPGYHDITQCWGQTSATCAWAGDPNVMPWQDDWAYQANADSLGGGPNNNARLTWRTQYGFLGQASYVVNDGVVADPPGLPGWPKKSYSVYVVLGTHSSAPVEAQVAQVETVQSLVLGATVGGVVTNGPAGATRADNVTYAPAGYDHVYGALAFTAAGNALDANISVGAGTLKKPLVIIGSYTGGYPTVKLGGVTLLQDVDYFPSLRAGASELWITLNRDLAGAVNHLEILSACVTPATPVASNDGPICAGATLGLSTPDVAGGNYSWTGPNGFASAVRTPSIPAATTAASGTYSVTVTVGACTSAAGSTNAVVNADVSAPVVTPPAPVSVDQTACCGAFGGATSAASAPLAAFLAGGSAVDDCSAAPVRLAPRAGGLDVTGASCFESGTTAVTFRFQDSSGKIGTAAANATVRMFGDLNLDAAVDPSDMVVLRAYFNFAVAPGTPPFNAPLSAADLTHDAAVDPSDMVVMRAYFNFAVGCLAP